MLADTQRETEPQAKREALTTGGSVADAVTAWLADEAQLAEGSRCEWIFAAKTGERPRPEALNPTLNLRRNLKSNGQPPSAKKRAHGPEPKPRATALAKDATIHDVQRSAADRTLNALHVPPRVIGHAILGHVRPCLIRTYQPNLPLDEAREALIRWAEELACIVGDAPAANAGREGVGAFR